MPINLTQSALGCLPADVQLPGYDRASLSPGIVHIGVGNFHRAHQAIFLDRLFAQGMDHDWGLIGAGVTDYDAAMRTDLSAQDWLTTVVDLDPQGLTARISGAMIDFTEVVPETLIENLSDPQIRIVSLTVTEGGYFVDAATGGFQIDHADIQRDIENPGAPRTVFGILIAALTARRADGTPPFTILSCDNLPENGMVTRRAVCELAQAVSPEIAAWISKNVAFPNTMVDCITPVTSDRERALVSDRFGITDARPVICEPFRQWILEDNFPTGRPGLEKAGAEFVEDVAPYELMKLRILNGGHAAIAYPAALLGIHFVHDAMADTLISGFLNKLITDEVIPTVPAIPGIDFAAYFENVVERFSNAVVGDTVPRLCLDGSNRQPKFILPTISARLESGLSIDGLALEVALWCRYCAAIDETGSPISLEDERAGQLTECALLARNDPSVFLALADILGDLGTNEDFADAFAKALDALWSDGVRETLSNYIKP